MAAIAAARIAIFIFLVIIGRKINILRNNANGQEESQENSKEDS